MKIKLICLSLLIMSVVTFGSQTPIPPQKPIVVMTNIGEVAGAYDKIGVMVYSVVNSKNISTYVQIKDDSMMGGKFDINVSSIPKLAELLNTASEKILTGNLFSGKAGKASVSVVEKDGEKVVIVRFETEGISFSSNRITLDADNAASLARILLRSKRVADWIAPKMKNLQK